MYRFHLDSYHTSQGNPLKQNEDGFFANDHRFVMVDGATGRAKNGRRFIKNHPAQTDAAWLVSEVIRLYPDFPMAETDLRQNIRGFGTLLNRLFLEHGDLPHDIEKSEVPCAAACFAVLHPKTRTIQTAGLADTETIIVFQDGSFEVLAADPRSEASEQITINHFQDHIREHGGTLQDAMQASTGGMRERASVTNSPNNRGVLNVWDVHQAPDECFINHRTYDAKDIERIIMYTDGVDSRFGLYTHQSLIDHSRQKSFQQLIDQIREIEKADPLGAKYPRTKVSDDATIACVIIQTT